MHQAPETDSISIFSGEDRQKAIIKDFIQEEPSNAMVQVASILYANKEAFRRDFDQWLFRNWPIWSRFEEESSRIWQRGRKKYSARTIIEYIRHETNLSERHDCTYKINNSYVPDLARLYGLIHPECMDFFEFRSMRSQSSNVLIRCKAN